MWVRVQELILWALPGRRGVEELSDGTSSSCFMPNTPEVSGWQSLGQASEQCWSWAWSEVRSAGVRERQSMAGQGLCSSLAVEQHEWALSRHVLLPLDSTA